MSVGTFRLRIGLLDEAGHKDILAHNLHEPKLDPRLAPDRLAGDLVSAPLAGSRGGAPAWVAGVRRPNAAPAMIPSGCPRRRRFSAAEGFNDIVRTRQF